MNDTVKATGAEVRDYVAQVRAALADLPPEDVEEFTTGMEADLAERLAEPGEGTLRDRLGDPETYAAELRSAAGLPPRVVEDLPKPPAAERLSEWWAGRRDHVLGVAPWLSDLRPIWWAVRGFAFAVIPALVVGRSIVAFGVLFAAISVALGIMARRGALTGDWVGPVRVIGNLIAIILIPFALVAFSDRDSYVETVYEGSSPTTPGLVLDGQPVTNVYGYDETGRRLDGIRLFDQLGRPLVVSPEFVEVSSGPEELDPLRDPTTGELRVPRDVFPLRWGTRTGWETVEGYGWRPPMAIQPLPGPVPEVNESPGPSASPSASPTVTPTPTSSPSATPTATPSAPGSGASAPPTPTTSPSR
ncbi:putative membrane protein [Knoellia remsis]|uniref:Putative membrane protein n=1 Tax=Knoellia remsis TaxID=407159 RepID=A0A2T0UJM6_9MICO|nr:hypothetical protein [Knoellia remsis]PRY58130.1 putative membrane protein [Knoellia remsis]